MPITVRWDDVMARVIVCTFRGKWMLDELEAAQNQIWDMIESRPGRIDQIRDNLSNLIALPPGYGQRIGAILEQAHPRTNLTVVVGHDISREILNALRMEHPRAVERWTFAFSLDEARQKIAESRGSND